MSRPLTKRHPRSRTQYAVLCAMAVLLVVTPAGGAVAREPPQVRRVERRPDEGPEEAAAREGGTVIDPGPCATYEDAYDALTDLDGEEDEEF